MAYKDPREPFSRINVDEAKAMITGGSAVVIDVREPHEYAAAHVPGAKLIPVNTIINHKDEIPDAGDLVFICAVGQRSALACEYAAALGKQNLYNVEGGTDAWVRAGLPVETGAPAVAR